MKKLKVLFIIIFFALLAVPLVAFNWEENVTSEIDNRALTNNPFGSNYVAQEGIGTAEAIDNYIQDRIGFRSEMITAYTVLNDRVFGEMVHPSYEYGKNGYVFSKMSRNPEYSEYHEDFVSVVKEIQDYCEARGVPFVFVFEPSKASVLTEYLPEGVNYQNDWVAMFLSELEAAGVNCVDNTKTLKEMAESGESVFNVKYNAGHWNDTGAFYGVNAILSELNAQGMNVSENEQSEFDIEQKLNTTLLVSKFAIHEYEPIYSHRCKIEYRQSQYEEMEIHDQYRYFLYAVNEDAKAAGSPKMLVFQGSYMNGMGDVFMENSLGEYIAVHDYQNVLEFDYYFNIFKPEGVVFEAAEYTFLDIYFSHEKMKSFQLNPVLADFYGYEEKTASALVTAERGNMLTKIKAAELDEEAAYVYYVIGDEIYDMRSTAESGEWEVTLENKQFASGKIITVNTKEKVRTVYEVNIF